MLIFIIESNSFFTEGLKDLFKPFGNIVYCKVLQDKNEVSRGIGFVRYEISNYGKKYF